MNWYKISQLIVKPLGATSDGYLTLNINGKTYRYLLQHPYSAESIANEINRNNSKGRGKQVKRIIDFLKNYLVRENELVQNMQ